MEYGEIKKMLEHPWGYGISYASVYIVMLYLEEVERRKPGGK